MNLFCMVNQRKIFSVNHLFFRLENSEPVIQTFLKHIFNISGGSYTCFPKHLKLCGLIYATKNHLMILIKITNLDQQRWSGWIHNSVGTGERYGSFHTQKEKSEEALQEIYTYYIKTSHVWQTRHWQRRKVSLSCFISRCIMASWISFFIQKTWNCEDIQYHFCI